MIQIKRIPVGVYAANCYVIMDENTKETAIIDPGGDVDDIEKAVDAMGAKVKYILLTHGHLDHTAGVEEFRLTFGVPVAFESRDENLGLNGGYMFGKLAKPAEISIKHGEGVKIGEIQIEFITTPGHTPGGVCFLIEKNIFAGDTLFKQSIGRTDLEGGNHQELIDSIKSKLMILPEDTIVYPGHGPSTTIGQEKVYNPFI